MTTMESRQGSLLWTAHPTRSRSGSPSAFKAIPSCRYSRRGVAIDCEHFYFECGQEGISLFRLYGHNPLEWSSEICLDVGVCSGGKARQKMTFLIHLRGHKPFKMQKNVLRQSEGSPVPITQGKMAQCAAEVVYRWLEEDGCPDGLRLEDLCLDSILQVGCTLQIYLAHRAPLEGPPSFECIAKAPRLQVSAGPSRRARSVKFEGTLAETAVLATVDQPYPYSQQPPLASSSYGSTLANYELYQVNPQPVVQWRQTPRSHPYASHSLSRTHNPSDRYPRNLTPSSGPIRAPPFSSGLAYPAEQLRRTGRRISESSQGNL